MTRAALALALVLGACRDDGATSCADPLGGVWQIPGELAPSGEPRRYHALDLGNTLELYPMFDDGLIDAADRKLTTPTAIVAAPAAIDLTRRGDALVGTISRRFVRADRVCVVRAPARVSGCRADRAVLEAALLPPPTDWATCAAAPTAVRWPVVRTP